eukprot:Amastigsp_a179038_389.p5 type:complete len:112 gc:universal Amastigsp_a179038_389:830-495(-)
MYRTRHDLSCAHDLKVCNTCCEFSSSESIDARATHVCTASRRTESCSSCASEINIGTISALTISFSIVFASAPRCDDAARRTMGVSSWHRTEYAERSPAWSSSERFGYATA